MSDLSIGLALLGGGTLVGVLAWNAWSARRLTPRQAVQAPDASGDAGPADHRYSGDRSCGPNADAVDCHPADRARSARARRVGDGAWPSEHADGSHLFL